MAAGALAPAITMSSAEILLAAVCTDDTLIFPVSGEF